MWKWDRVMLEILKIVKTSDLPADDDDEGGDDGR